MNQRRKPIFLGEILFYCSVRASRRCDPCLTQRKSVKAFLYESESQRSPISLTENTGCFLDILFTSHSWVTYMSDNLALRARISSSRDSPTLSCTPWVVWYSKIKYLERMRQNLVCFIRKLSENTADGRKQAPIQRQAFLIQVFKCHCYNVMETSQVSKQLPQS